MNIRLRTFLIALLLMVSSLPVLVFLVWPFTAVYDARIEEVRERHLLLARNVSGALKLYQEDIKTTMQAFSGSIVSSDAQDARAVFKHLGFYHVCVVNKTTGIIEKSYLAEEYPCPEIESPDMLALLLDLADEDDPGLSGVIAPDGAAPKLLVVSDQGNALVVGAVGMAFFHAQQSAISFGQNGHAAIVDQFGHVMAHPNAQWEAETRDLSGLDIVQSLMQGGTGVMQFFSPAFNEDMIAGYTAVPGVGWGVIVPQPLSELRSAAQIFNREVLLILLVGLAASLCAAFFLARMFERRLDNIQQTISNIAYGADRISLGTAPRAFNIATFHKLEQSIIKMFSTLKTAREVERDNSIKLEQSNARLQSEINTRRSAQTGLSTVEERYSNLFENVPIAIREDDVSGVKKKVDALQCRNLAELERYLDENPSFLAECGRAVKILDVNNASLKLYNLTQKSELKSRVLAAFGPESLKFLRSLILAVYTGKTGGRRQTVIYRLSGQPRHLISTWSVLPGYEATYGRCLLTSIDITEQVEMENALRQSQKMEAIGQLTGGVAHDFNNLLAVMQGNAELLAMNPAHDKEFIAPITKAVKSGAELTQRLLAFSRKQSLAPTSVDLAELTTGMGTLLRRTLGPNINITIHGEVGLFNVHADPGQIEAALLNLALNARDAMPSGGTLSILSRPADPNEIAGLDLEPTEYAVLSVSDTGEGIAEKDIPHVFEPFFTTKPVGKGSGLGLSMVYGFSRQSKGDVTIKSVRDIGTTLCLFLPRARDAETGPAIADAPETTQKTAGIRILVLDDNRDVLVFMAKSLLQQGYHVLTATNVEEARAIMDTEDSIDVLVSDVLLPGNQDGPDFAVEFRKAYGDRPVIFVSGYPADHQEARKERLGKTLWLAKPFRAAALSAAIEQLVFD